MAFQILEKFQQFSSQVKWTTFILVSIFSISSWICSTSVWTELSVIVYEVEEGWRLPSILTVIAQLGQIFPAAIYPLIKYKKPNLFRNRTIIFIKLAIEMCLMILLLFVWNNYILIANENRSIGLYFINFCFSVFDGLSIVTYLPFIQEYLRNEYIIANFIGESFSSLLPSSITFVQGVEDHDEASCQSQSVNSSTIAKFKPKINFSVPFYFTIILACMLLSSFAFLILNYNLASRSKRLKVEAPESEANNIERASFMIANAESTSSPSSKTNKEGGSTMEKVLLLSTAFIMCFFMFGVLLGLQSYSTLAYGHTAFHMSINLGNLFLPLAIFLSIWSYELSMVRFFIEFAFGLLFSAYIVAVSVFSPCPPLVKHWSGPWLVVTAWILAECIFTRLRCVVASKLERYKDERLLVLLGSVSLIGQICGGVLIYLLVDVYRFFKHKPDCIFDFSYCENY